MEPETLRSERWQRNHPTHQHLHSNARQYKLMVSEHGQHGRPAGGNARAFRYAPLVLCTAVTTSILTWSVAVRTPTAADVVRLGSALLTGANCSTTVSATAAASTTREEDHRKAVIDRLYSGADAADHLGSLQLLDPTVSALPCSGISMRA